MIPSTRSNVDPRGAVMDTGDSTENAARDAGVTRAASTGDGRVAEHTVPHQTGRASTSDWRASIEDPELRKAAQRFNSVADLVKAHGDLRRKLSTAIAPPGADASPAERATYRRRLGVPSTPEDYGYTVPDGAAQSLGDGLDHGLQEFLTTMHEAAAPRGVVHAALNWYFDHVETGAQQAAAQQAQATADAEALLRREWGGDYERNIALAARGLAQFFGDESAEIKALHLAGGGMLGSHPGFVRGLAQIGALTVEGSLHVGGTGAATASGAEERIKELRALQDTDPHAYASAPVQNELRSLYEALYDRPGSTPVP